MRETGHRLLREPLVHFVVAALALFGVSAAIGGDDVVEVSREEIEWRILQLEAERGSPLDPEERGRVEDAYVDERILIREARALGLTADERIDDILVQKMLHVLSGDVIQPSDDELAAWYGADPERYLRPASVNLDELVVREGEALPAALRAGGAPESLPTGAVVGHRVMTRLDRTSLEQLFGPVSADSILEAGDGTWVEAYRSARGHHWFRVRERVAAEVPDFDQVRDLVRRDWIVEQEERRLAERVAELRARYEVVVEPATPR